MADEGLYAALMRRGMSRRTFLQLTAAMTAALALPASYAPRITKAVEAAPRIPVIWLRGQACGGNSEALLRTVDPTASDILLQVLAVEYDATLMVATGDDAELARTSAMERFPNGYLAVIEGAVPKAGGGNPCLVGGRPFVDVAREVCDGAIATIALGSCAFDGGIAASNGGSTDAEGVRSVSGDSPVIALPGCPANAANIAALVVHYVTFGGLPPTDMMGRPLFAYGDLIHNKCERRPHFEFGEFALTWGDEGAQKGWCLYKVGCKGPETMGNCPTVRYGGGVSWNIRAGHGCIGCFAPNFWDGGYLPAYERLPGPVPLFPTITVDQVGVAAVAGIGAVALAHGTGMAARSSYRHRKARREAARAAAAANGSEALEAAAGEPIAVAVAEPEPRAVAEPEPIAVAVAEPEPLAVAEPEVIAEPASAPDAPDAPDAPEASR